MTKVRINKFLSDSGVSSRRNSEQFILEKRVSVNKKIITELSFKIDPENDIVTLDGERIKPRRHIYILLNKPKGYITSVSDERDRRTVLDLIKTKDRIYPVGRLDYDTNGLLFLTNDGDFSQLLTHPKNKVPREYEVKLDKPVSEEDKKSLLNGVKLEGKKGKFINLSFSNSRDKKNVNIVCEEGRNRFVKRMFGRLGYKVINLTRTSFAEIRIDIPTGKYRNLTTQEVNFIKEKFSTDS